MNTLITIILLLAAMSVGAVDICRAAECFQAERYGWFGWYTMLAIWMISIVFKIEFKL